MHLSLDMALDLIEGRADSSKAALWMNHVETCKNCGDQIEQWRHMKELLARTHLESAPDWLIKRGVAVFGSATEPQRSGFREVVASLVFDSFSQPALAGARGAMDARQLVLRAEEFDIHLKIWGEQEQRHLVGQILPRGESSFVGEAKLHLLRNGERLESTLSDYFGEFKFRDIPQGLLSLQIDLPHLTVVGALNMMDMR